MVSHSPSSSADLYAWIARTRLTETTRCAVRFFLAPLDAHSIKRRGDMFIGPATSHAAHHRQGILSGGTTVFTGLRLTDLEFRMLTALPMDRQHHVTHRIVDMRHAASGEKGKKP
ncbi:hypothetical protein HU757_32210 [Rhizobium laguerreae]|nr:hypothetical protein [Rhizobium laguerreae]